MLRLENTSLISRTATAGVDYLTESKFLCRVRMPTFTRTSRHNDASKHPSTSTMVSMPNKVTPDRSMSKNKKRKDQPGSEVRVCQGLQHLRRCICLYQRLAKYPMHLANERAKFKVRRKKSLSTKIEARFSLRVASEIVR